jgi:hypothetical protein
MARRLGLAVIFTAPFGLPDEIAAHLYQGSVRGYSARSVIAGSTRDARQAGIALAIADTARKMASTPR